MLDTEAEWGLDHRRPGPSVPAGWGWFCSVDKVCLEGCVECDGLSAQRELKVAAG